MIMTKLFSVILFFALSSTLGVSAHQPGKQLTKSGCKRSAFIELPTLAELLQPLSQNPDVQTRLDTFGYAVTNAIEVCSPRSSPFDDIEVESSGLYLCAKNAKTNNQASFFSKALKFKHEGAFEKGFTGPLDFNISYVFYGGFVIQFLNSYVKLPMAIMSLTGNLAVKFREFNIDLTLTTEPTSTLADKLSKHECFLHIKNFEASLTKPSIVFPTVNHETTYSLWMNKVDSLVMMEINHIKEVAINKVKARFYEGLINSGEWVCMDDNVKEVLDKKWTTTKLTVPSASFQRYCHADLK